MSLSFSLEKLCVERDGLRVIDCLSYANEEPAWIGLVGANGSGKTTLLRAIAGRLPIRSGRVLIGGVDRGSDRAARAEQIGFAVENGMLPAELTPREVFAISARDPTALDDPAVASLRGALNLEHFLDRRCGALSAGMGQRVALLGAFLDLPPIVILDEPFNWLDPLTAFDVKVALRDLVRARSLTLITALHEVSTLTAHCDRGILLSNGRIALTMERDALRAGLADPVSFETAMVEQLRAAG